MSDYTNQVLGATPTPDNTAVFSMQMENFDRQLRKMNKRKNGKGRKKLKKRLRMLEQENQQLKQLILLAMYQSRMQTVEPERKPWWQEAVTNSLPKALELAAVSVSRLPPRNQPPLTLPEAQGRK